MTTINKKHKKEITAFRKDILAEMAAQDKVFSKLCKKLNIDPDGEDGDALFDHIYNGTDWTIEYTDENGN
jgi:hypothetical protein